MGTKRYLASYVSDLLSQPVPRGGVVDLFAGSGAVSSELASRGVAVIANDNLNFICCLQRAQLLPMTGPYSFAARDLIEDAEPSRRRRMSRYSGRIARDRRALEAGPDGLRSHMNAVPNVLSSPHLVYKYSRARASGVSTGDMTVDYFGSRYFSTKQAVALDALRESIDRLMPVDQTVESDAWFSATGRDVALGAWLLAASAIANTSGHGAQYLKSTPRGFGRIAASWSRSVEVAFARAFERLQLRNAKFSSPSNIVTQYDAQEFFLRWNGRLAGAYADPPYTKDHYSRMYHLHESLYLYDQPVVAGAGLARREQTTSDFGYRSRAKGALARLLRGAHEKGCPLVLSYPGDGLLRLTTDAWRDFIDSNTTLVDVIRIPVSYSTLGGSKGARDKVSEEQIFVLK